MSGPLAVSREYLERALAMARSRQAARELGERVCELMELEELEELRMLRTSGGSTVCDGTPQPAGAQARRVRQLNRALRRKT
jgi:hypothetical protein